MYSFALEYVAVWHVDANVEQHLCDCDALDKKWESVRRSLEAVECDERDAVEYAERDDIMQADDAGANEIELCARRSDHGGLIADCARQEGECARMAVLLSGFVLLLMPEGSGGEFMDDDAILNSFLNADESGHKLREMAPKCRGFLYVCGTC